MILHYLLFKLIRFAFGVVDALCHLVTGYSLSTGRGPEVTRPRPRTTHVASILWRSRRMALDGAKSSNFILLHDRWSHWSVIFHPNVTLLCLEKAHAIFVDCNGHDVHKNSTGPFFYNNQFKLAKSLIAVPLQDFIEAMQSEEVNVADHVGLTLLSNTGRCGSTLLLQLFESLPQAASINEPEVILQLADNPNDYGDHRKGLLKACLKFLLLKASEFGGKKHVMIKPKAIAVAATDEILQAFPDAKHIYLFRNPYDYVKSIKTIVESLTPFMVRSFILQRSSNTSSMAAFVMSHFGDPNCAEAMLMKRQLSGMQLVPDHVGYAMMFVANLMNIKNWLKHHPDRQLQVVSYQELKNQTQSVIDSILCQTGLVIEKEIELPSQDSQDNTALSRTRLKDFRQGLTKAQIESISKVLTLFQLPTDGNFPTTGNDMLTLLRQGE